MTDKPNLILLTAENEEPLPGLEQIEDEVRLQHVRDRESLQAALPGADILLVTDFRTEMLQSVWPREHHISWVHATSAGVDALMFPELVADHVPVTNARGIFDRGIAEYVLGAVLMFAKDTLGNIRYQRRHEWNHRETELIHDRTVVVVGAGSIGREVSRCLRAVGMRVLGTARNAREDEHFDAVHSSDRLHELLPEADFVVITVPLTDETRGLFNTETISWMKPSARLINVGRGPVVVEEDLIMALRNRLIAGAALDVFESEPLDEHSPLWDLPEVMISAHMAGDFIGWRRALGEQFVDNYQRWKRGRPLLNIVDKDKGYASRGS